MSKSVKSIFWSLLLLSIYMSLQFLTNMGLAKERINVHPNYSDPQTWWMSLFLKQANIHIKMLLPIFISMLIYFLLYNFVLKEKIASNYGFSKTNIRSVFIGIALAVTMVLLYSLIFNNHLWEELLYKKGIINILRVTENTDLLAVTRNTIYANIVIMLPMVIVIPFLKKSYSEGLFIINSDKSFHSQLL